MDECHDPRMIYLPPWCDGGPEYGPRTSHEYERAWRDWTESIYGGGLWDDDADPNRRRASDLDEARQKYDHAPMSAFADKCWHRIPDREKHVFRWYWQEGLSLAGASRSMGVSQRQVHRLVNRLRRRMKHYVVRHTATVSRTIAHR